MKKEKVQLTYNNKTIGVEIGENYLYIHIYGVVGFLFGVLIGLLVMFMLLAS